MEGRKMRVERGMEGKGRRGRGGMEEKGQGSFLAIGVASTPFCPPGGKLLGRNLQGKVVSAPQAEQKVTFL